MKKREFENKVIIVAGATGGIGYPTCIQLARKGAVIVAVGRSADRLKKLMREVSPESLSSFSVGSDLSRPGAWNEIVNRVWNAFHRIDVLVNCAGVLVPGTLESLSDEDIQFVISLNFINCVRSARAVVPIMKRRQSGQLVFVGSLGGIVPMPYEALYSATKFAVRGFSRSLSAELRGSGIRVSHLSPGPVRTHMLTTESEDRYSTITFTTKPLEAEIVAASIVSLVRHPREERIIPRWQGTAAFLLNASPRFFSILSPLLRAVGRRNQDKYRKDIVSQLLAAGDLR